MKDERRMGEFRLTREGREDSHMGSTGPVSKETDNSPKREKDPKREAIAQHLKDAYRSVVDEPLPDMFEDLLSQLDGLDDTGPSSKSD